MSRLRLTALLTATLLAFTATAALAQQDDWPDWLNKAMSKETKRLKYKQVSTDDELYSVSLAGKPGDSGAFEGGYYWESDIKGEAVLECYIFTEPSDLATLVSNLTELGIEAQAETNGGAVANRSVAHLDAGAIDGAPFLAIEWLYTMGEAPNTLVGYSKVRAARNGNIIQACAHNFTGYRDTFAKAFEEFVKSAQQPANDTPPYYEEVALMRLGEQNIGVAHSAYRMDDEGDTQIVTHTTSIVPVAPGVVSSDDAKTTSWSTADGRLINSYSASAQNGELSHNLQLQRDDEDNWQVSGEMQGKPIAATLDGALQPLSEIGQMQTAAALFAGEEQQATFLAWLPDADPTKILEGSITRDDAEVANQGTLAVGPLSMSARFDESGSVTSAGINIGAAVMTLERIWKNGALE
jgi:hypothetical protein